MHLNLELLITAFTRNIFFQLDRVGFFSSDVKVDWLDSIQEKILRTL